MEKNPKIITCEKCFNIPSIIIFTQSKVKIECRKCNTSKIEDISYFEKYRTSKNENFPQLPKCSFDENHKEKSLKYCIKCTKYLCSKCIEIHNITFKGKSHILLGQSLSILLHKK